MRLLWALAALVLVVSTTLWSPFCDGRMDVYDTALYGRSVEAADSLSNDPELGGTNANHILYHLALFGCTRGLEFLGVSHPGHLATQVLGGLGTALTILIIGAMAGPRRRWIGLSCALVVVSMRGSFYHACAGETVPLATALSLLTFFFASKERPNLHAVALSLGFAFLARQDSVFITPAVFALLVGRVRFFALFRAFAIAGAMPVVTWYLVWSWNDAINEIATFRDFVLGIGNHGTYSFADVVELSPIYLLGVAFHNAFFPQFDALDEVPIALGLIPVAVLSFAAVALRGRSGGLNSRFLIALVLLVVFRQAFFLWFEPQNWEWQVPPVAIALGLLARATRGEPVFGGWVRPGAVAALVVLAAAVFSTHIPSSMRARHNHLEQAVEQAVSEAGAEAQYLCLGYRPHRLLEWRGYDSTRLADAHPSTALPSDWQVWPPNVLPFARTQGRDTVFLVDVFVRNGQPRTREVLGEVVKLSSVPGVAESDELTFLWHQDRLFGLWAHPER